MTYASTQTLNTRHRHTVAYIVSSSFSGSTLLALILNAHPEVATISEFTEMENIARDQDFRCSCGEKIRECPFFLELRKEILSQDIPFEIDDMDMILKLHKNRRINAVLTEKIPFIHSTSLESLRDRLIAVTPGFSGKLSRMQNRNKIFIDTILRINNASVFVDANKSPYRMLFLSQSHNVKGLYLYKNGIAGVYSYLKSARRGGRARTVEQATRRWFHEQITISRCLTRLGRSNYLQIAYSTLCNRTEDVLATISDFLGIERVSLNEFADVPHHVIGNAMRLGDFSEIRERTDWKEKLTEAEIETYRRESLKYLPRLRSINPEVADCIWR